MSTCVAALYAAPAGAPSFDPSDLFTGGEDGGWWEPADLSTVFQERTGASATTAAGVGDPVGTILDKSGNGNHMVAPSDAARPILRQSASLYYLEFDGTDDILNTTISGMSTTSVSVTGIDASADTGGYILHSQNGAARFYFCGQNASTSSSYLSVGSPTMRVDGAALGGTQRGDVFTALSTGAVVATAESLDMTSWTDYSVCFWPSGGFALDGNWFGTVLLDRAFTGDERADLEQYIADLSGVTL